MQKNSDNLSIHDAMKLAKSPAGQQLFAALRSKDSTAIDKVMEQAATGDYSQIKNTLSSLLDSPEIKAMLDQLGRQTNG